MVTGGHLGSVPRSLPRAESAFAAGQASPILIPGLRLSPRASFSPVGVNPLLSTAKRAPRAPVTLLLALLGP